MTSPTPSLIIHGPYGNDVWVESEGDLVCLTRRDMVAMIEHVNNWAPLVVRAGITFDESDLIELTNALNGPQLDDCHNGCEAPGLVLIEGHVVCPSCAAGYGAREASA